MGKFPSELRETIARNIRECRLKKYPGRGGGKRCAIDFGVSPQQWSPWERGMRTPDELRLSQIAQFFGVTVEFLRRDNSIKLSDQEKKPSPPPAYSEGGDVKFVPPHVAYPPGRRTGITYVPVFVVLPHIPENFRSVYDQFSAMMNGEEGKKNHPGV